MSKVSKVRLYVLGVVLFLQGCETELPLFKDDESVNPKDAVVVFNMYTTDNNYREPGILSEGARRYIYVENDWKSQGKEALLLKDVNHLGATGMKSRYIVAKLAPGTYNLHKFFKVYAYSSGSYVHTITLSSPKYNEKSTPLTFTVSAGDVKYLGDIEIQRSTLSGKAWIPLYSLHNRFADAKEFMKKRYPSLQAKLTQGLLEKTQIQTLLERQYSTENTYTLLNEVKNAK